MMSTINGYHIDGNYKTVQWLSFFSHFYNTIYKKKNSEEKENGKKK